MKIGKSHFERVDENGTSRIRIVHPTLFSHLGLKIISLLLAILIWWAASVIIRMEKAEKTSTVTDTKTAYADTAAAGGEEIQL